MPRSWSHAGTWINGYRKYLLSGRCPKLFLLRENTCGINVARLRISVWLARVEFAFQQVDVFSSKPLLGNPLAVVIGADALSDEQMAAFASWTNLSETTFLLKSKSPDADYRVRIFTRQREVPFAGHPTLGSCHVWLAAGGVAKGPEIVQECGLGLIRIRTSPHGLSFVAPKLVRGGPVEPEILARVVRELDLAPDGIIASNGWTRARAGWRSCCVPRRSFGTPS
jgi:PhzF family phenazine biosynthesis protein